MKRKIPVSLISFTGKIRISYKSVAMKMGEAKLSFDVWINSLSITPITFECSTFAECSGPVFFTFRHQVSSKTSVQFQMFNYRNWLFRKNSPRDNFTFAIIGNPLHIELEHFRWLHVNIFYCILEFKSKSERIRKKLKTHE